MQDVLWQELEAIEQEHWWLVSRRRIFLHFLKKVAAEIPHVPLVLDCGCGTGTLLECLEEFSEAVGIDIDERSIRACQMRAQRAVQADVNDLPFAEGSFDIVCAFDLLEHLENPLAALSRMRFVLREDGFLLLSVPAYETLWDPQDDLAGHKRRYRRSQLRRTLTTSGFEPVKLTYFNTLLFPLVAAVRIYRKAKAQSMLSRGQPQTDFSLTRPGIVNDALRVIFVSELLWLAGRTFPFGGSIFAIARRRAAPGKAQLWSQCETVFSL